VEVERKLATVVFVDLVDSTSLVAGADPEVVRRRVTRFFDQVSKCVELHGGKVEKFAGDAVMAAFGIPQAHEDDAERAVRAALAMLDAVQELGLPARIGIESGEVVAEEGDSTFATGEAVNVAARLQQAAEPGQILLGPVAHGLTVGRIETEDLGPLRLRGLDRGVWAWRVLGAPDQGIRNPNLSAPFVGRSFELALLQNTWQRAQRDGRAYLVTIYGDPGVGKSRLTAEFVEGLEGATILKGRALPYGEGVTYWPFSEMVKAAAGISDDDPTAAAVEKLRKTCEDEAVADLLGLATGVLEALEGERGQTEIAWAAREFVEQLASAQPVVLLFEDIHWAEEPLLDLIEHLASWVREAPLLILCLARPELLDGHASWGGGNPRASSLELTALDPDESVELVHALLDSSEPLTPALRETLLEKTEGNPLFLEETVRTIEECGAERALAGIPDTLHALIAARIDRLPIADKGLLQRAAVIGRVFWAGSIEALAADGTDVEKLLDDLLLRDFVLREPRSTITGERAFRFKHVLIREVAYSGLSKSARATYHRRFAGWLKERAGEELLEIRAYHLDQAATLLAELDGAAPGDLASEAAAALYSAGKRALAREANRAGRTLLLRAVELGPTLERRYHAARAAWRITDYPAIETEMQLVRDLAHDAGDAFIEGRAVTALAEVAVYRDADPDRAAALARRALELLPAEEPDARFDALGILAQVALWTGDLTASERLDRQQLEIAQETGRADLEARAVHALAENYLERLQHDKALPMIERASELAETSGSIVQLAYAHRGEADVHLLRNELDEADEHFEQARRLFEEAGAEIHRARTMISVARVAARKGDLPRAERVLRKSIGILKPLGDRGTLCEAQRQLAQILVGQGKVEEAEIVALEARQTVGPNDHGSRSSTRMALGLVRAAQSRDEEAERLLRDAIEVLEGTELLSSSVEPLTALVDFLRERGRDSDAEPFARRLLELAPANALADAFEAGGAWAS
jgi:class 3 adenylate cyclase/tetratricopeptide (TPR) repeat protein